MISGMTGFGRAEGALDGWSWAVEARSVNGRNLEIRFRGPPGFDGLERMTREAAQARFQRGQVNVGVQAKRAEAAAAVRINIEQLERYLAASSPYVATGLAAAPRMDGLLALRGVIEAADGEEDAEAQARVEAAIAASIAQALDQLALTRGEEGRQLSAVLTGQVDRISELTAAAEGQAAGQPPPSRPSSNAGCRSWRARRPPRSVSSRKRRPWR
jgi:uncharacterized protein (TIGR00255 family)